MTLSKHCVPVKIFSSQVETSSVKGRVHKQGECSQLRLRGKANQGRGGEGDNNTFYYRS